MVFVADTNVCGHDESRRRPDVPAHELQPRSGSTSHASGESLLARLRQENDHQWTDKGLFNDEMIVRLLLDQNLLKPIEPRAKRGVNGKLWRDLSTVTIRFSCYRCRRSMPLERRSRQGP